jgi:formylglycine-generating enzyme required for sulfatase activity
VGLHYNGSRWEPAAGAYSGYANAYGLYDMHGNVWEWCLDWYSSYASSPVTDPVGSTTGSDRVLRRGSWLEDLSDYGGYGGQSRSAARHDVEPDIRSCFFGFRVVFYP